MEPEVEATFGFITESLSHKVKRNRVTGNFNNCKTGSDMEWRRLRIFYVQTGMNLLYLVSLDLELLCHCFRSSFETQAASVTYQDPPLANGDNVCGHTCSHHETSTEELIVFD